MAQTASEGRYGITKQLLNKLKSIVGVSSSTIAAPLAINDSGKLALLLSQVFNLTEDGILQIKNADTTQFGIVKKTGSLSKSSSDVPTADSIFRGTLTYRRNLTAEDDLDNFLGVDYQGIWLNKSVHPIHEPEVINGWYYLINFGGEFNIQVIFSSGTMYIRHYGGSPIAWSAWYKFSGTAIV